MPSQNMFERGLFTAADTDAALSLRAVWGSQVRRQTRNIASVLRAASDRGRYFLFLEDDMLLCPHAMRAAVYLVDRATS